LIVGVSPCQTHALTDSAWSARPLAIDVDHGDGTVVQIDVATCLAWNGRS
jgi:hypothetical protein